MQRELLLKGREGGARTPLLPTPGDAFEICVSAMQLHTMNLYKEQKSVFFFTMKDE